MKSFLLLIRARFFQWIHKPRMLNNIYINPNGTKAKNTRFSSTVDFVNKKQITLGTNIYIGHYAILDGTAGLEIDDGCQIAARVSILTHSSHISIRLFGYKYSLCKGIESEGYNLGKVKIGKFTFIGTGAIITNGVTIGKGCIVGANSFVNSDIPDYAIAHGSPAKIIGYTKEADSIFLKNNQQFQEYYNEWNNE